MQQTDKKQKQHPRAAPNEFSDIQSKYQKLSHSRMRPDPAIQSHPAYPTLLRYATEGCPVQCGEPWSREHLEEAIERGPHISATSPEAAIFLHEEAREKEKIGHARIINWEDIKENPPPNLKISPIAAIEHKSRLYRSILDLSYKLRLRGVKMPSVNENTVPMSDHKAMEQMGQALWRLVAAIGNTNPHNGPIVFAKWDIKDGFWRLVVSEEDAWHFAYVLPRLNATDPIQIVVPTCLQMGWCESPPLFCTASETARDVAQDLWDSETDLEPHPLEIYSIPNELNLPELTSVTSESMANLLEVYMDDFFGMLQAPTIAELHKFTRSILYGIHAVFPPPGPSEDQTDEPISVKKLKAGDGLWSTQKEILGWLFDGVSRCMQLPNDKVSKIRAHLIHISRQKMIRLGELEKLNGRLMHATIGIPNGRGLLSPLIATIATKGKSKFYKNKLIRLNTETKQALRDWKELLRVSNLHPTPCADLLPATATYGGYCDASKKGAGGVWFGIDKLLPPIVWRIALPQHLQDEVVSFENPKGTISNSDLEMLGLLLQWLVLEHFADLAHTHVACWCDNTPTVAWASKLLASKAKRVAQLLWILALRMLACQASPLTTFHVAGTSNRMADFASRSFQKFPTTKEFLTEFHSQFPLPQNGSWIAFQFPTKTLGRLFSLLSTTTPTLESWSRLKLQGSVIGGTGRTSFQSVSIHTFRTWMLQNASWSSKLSLDGSGKVFSEEDAKSKPVASKQRLAPLPRPSNWLASQTQFIAQVRPTTMQRSLSR